MSLTPNYSVDGSLYAWTIEEHVAPVWDKYAQDLSFRTYTPGKSNSKTKAAHRLSYILKDNAHYLHGSRSTDMDVLCDEFISQLGSALQYMKEKGVDRINQQVGAEFNARLTFWTFCRDLKNIHMLSNALRGTSAIEDIADMNRRKEKGRIIREFNDDVKSFIKKAAYIVGSGPDSNRRLEQALELARQALMRAEEDLEWEEN